ncbi:hypothetical protein KR222_011836 [Zaprionus bogoriensis]|nr:hypothetical protein KR222_011836 [Zaprionus bogoriensis]
MTLYSLYQDPMQSQRILIPYTGIGYEILPQNWVLSDPVFLRHVLCMMIIVRNMFHVCLCWRQLKLCNSARGPPRIMEQSFTEDTYEKARSAEMVNVEHKLCYYILDAMYSCLELYFGIFPLMWRIIVSIYGTVDDFTWQNIAFMGLLATYMMLRGLPLMFYTKLVLEPFYSHKPEKSLPVVGLLCTYSLFVVLIQVVLIPLTTIFLFIEANGGQFFVLWIWGFLLIVTGIVFILCNVFGLPMIGKSVRLTDGELSDALMGILSQFKFPIDGVYIVQSYNIFHPTAFAWGCCKFRHLMIMQNLLFNCGKAERDLHPDDVGKGLHTEELVAYVVHELSHWYHYHSFSAFCMLHATLLVYMIIFGLIYRFPVLYEAAGFPAKFYPPIVGYWLVYKYCMPLYLTITNWIVFFFLQRFEYSADRNAWKLGYSNTLISALLKLNSDNPLFPYVDNLYLMWHRYKPTCMLRIRRMVLLDRPSKSRGFYQTQ